MDRLCKLPSEAMALAKLTITLRDGLDLDSARDAEQIANTILLKDPAYQERVQATKNRIQRDGSAPVEHEPRSAW